jgi:polar amino acid transport system substrate-binding protein
MPFSILAKIRIAYVDAPPYAYQDKANQANGQLIEMFRELALVINEEAQFIYLPHRRQIDFIEQGKVDLWAGQKDSLVNSELSLVSATPLFSMELQVYWKKGSPPMAALLDLQDKHLILISSYAYGGNYSALVTNSKSVTYVVNHEDGFNQLFSADHKYLLGYQKIAQQVVDKFNIKGFQKASMAKYDLYLKLSKNYPNATAVMKKINDYLAIKNTSKIGQ